MSDIVDLFIDVRFKYSDCDMDRIRDILKFDKKQILDYIKTIPPIHDADYDYPYTKFHAAFQHSIKGILSAFTEEELLKLLPAYCHLILYIKDPSVKLQQAVVEQLNISYTTFGKYTSNDARREILKCIDDDLKFMNL